MGNLHSTEKLPSLPVAHVAWGPAIAQQVGGIYQHLDVTSESDWIAAVAVTEKAFGPIAILINNAGVVGSSD